MTLTGKQMTAEELWRLPDDGMRHELIYGELTTMSPSGSEHGWVAMRVGADLHAFVARHRLGRAYAAETGFLLARDPDLVRAPDAAFVRQERLAAVGETRGYFPGAPDLAVEIVSPGDRAEEVYGKVREYPDAGARLVWVVWPRHRAVTVYTPDGQVHERREGDELDGGDVLPGFRVRVAELFAAIQ